LIDIFFWVIWTTFVISHFKVFKSRVSLYLHTHLALSKFGSIPKFRPKRFHKIDFRTIATRILYTSTLAMTEHWTSPGAYPTKSYKYLVTYICNYKYL
jgi:hypothetical protein